MDRMCRLSVSRECVNAVWDFRFATDEEISKYRAKLSCSKPNMEYVQCEPPEPITCRVSYRNFVSDSAVTPHETVQMSAHV